MFADLGRYLRAGDLLVLNDTRVFPARLLGRRVPSGGAVECLLMGQPRPAGTGDAPGAEEWDALVHPGQKLKPGARMVFEGAGGVLHGEILARRFQGRRTVRLWTDDPDGVAAVDRSHRPRAAAAVHQARRSRRRSRALSDGLRAPSAARSPRRPPACTSPPALLAALRGAGVEQARVTLHVGYGTFKPVRVERVEEHEVDPEWYSVSEAAAAALTARAPRGPSHHRRRHDDGARARIAAISAADGQVRAASGETRAVHPPRSPVPAGGRPDHQLPPAAIVAADARRRVRRPRADPRRLPRGRRAAATASTATATRC